MKLRCTHCHKIFSGKKRKESKNRFCSSDCWYAFNRGSKQTPEFIAKRSAAMKGKPKNLNADQRKALSDRAKAQWASGSLEHLKGREVSEETRKKIAKSHLKTGNDSKHFPSDAAKARQPLDRPRKCKLCGKSFIPKDSGHNTYCGDVCLQKALVLRDQNRVREYRIHSKICDFCGKEFKGRKNQQFCSYDCDKANKSKMALLTFTCLRCGTQMEMRGAEARKKKYCDACQPAIKQELALNASRAAYAKMEEVEKKTGYKKPEWVGKNNPTFAFPYKNKGVKYYEDLDQHFRSTWEANMMRIFNHLGLCVEYEPLAFPLSNGTTYIPDFYIHDTDEWIEVKGYWREVAKQKVRLFKEEYPDISFQVIGPVRYRNYKKQFKNLIALS